MEVILCFRSISFLFSFFTCELHHILTFIHALNCRVKRIKPIYALGAICFKPKLNQYDKMRKIIILSQSTCEICLYACMLNGPFIVYHISTHLLSLYIISIFVENHAHFSWKIEKLRKKTTNFY